MKITLNGNEISTNAHTITELVKEQGMEGKPVVVEYNKKALVASAHSKTQIAKGDSVEMFVLGAGG